MTEELEEYDQKLIDKFMNRFISAEPVNLTGNEAWKLYLKLQELKECKERCDKLLRLIDELTSKNADIRCKANVDFGFICGSPSWNFRKLEQW